MGNLRQLAMLGDGPARSKKPTDCGPWARWSSAGGPPGLLGRAFIIEELVLVLFSLVGVSNVFKPALPVFVAFLALWVLFIREVGVNFQIAFRREDQRLDRGVVVHGLAVEAG